MRISLRSLTCSFFIGTVIFGISQGSSAQVPFTGKPQYQIEVRRADTVMGRIIVELFPAIAPMSVENWDSLVAIHFYDSTAFHRVIPGFMIQGGDPNSISGDPSTWGYGDPSQQTVDAEFSAVSHRRGILSAARANDPNSATSQFFICVANYPSLDRKYSVYGHVISGMNIADSIVKAPRDMTSNRPFNKISMFVTRIGSNDSLTATPTLASPADGYSNGTSVKATLRWHLVPGAMMYELQLATDSLFDNIITDSTFNQIDTVEAAGKLVNGTTYFWHVLANNGGHVSEYSPTWKFNVQSLGVAQRGRAESSTPELELSDPLPNPTKGGAVIGFRLNQEAAASAHAWRLTVQDMLGRDVITLFDGTTFESGDHQITIPPNALLPGIYICRMECLGKALSKKLVVE